MILKLMGLARRSELDKMRKDRDVEKATADYFDDWIDALIVQNAALSEAYEDLRRDRDRLAKKLKVTK